MPTLEKMILAIDSSIGSGVAIVDAASDEVRGQASSEAPRGHAEVIGTLIAQALAEANATPADITHVAAGMGPGPFTGLRIGIAAARAFAIGRGIPVVPVASHDAAALAVLDEDPSARFVVVTDARRRENAVSAYAGLAGDLPNRTAGPELLPHTEDPSARLAALSRRWLRVWREDPRRGSGGPRRRVRSRAAPECSMTTHGRSSQRASRWRTSHGSRRR